MYWGIDLGGTKIEGVVMSELHPSAVIARHRIDTQSSGGYPHILQRIKNVVDDLSNKTGSYPEILGIGTPGTMDPATATLKNSNTVCLNHKPFHRDLEEVLQCKVMMANDANCFVLAEYKFGVVSHHYPEAKVIFGVIMGTGVGGGIIVHDHLITGHHGIGGEWGHMFLDNSGDMCYCGRKGCVEMLISGPALERFYFSKTGTSRKLADILSDQTDPAASEVKERLVYFYGKALGQVINLIDPDVIIIGGGLGNIEFLYHEGYRSVAANVFNSNLTTPITKPMLGDSAGVFGAALLTSA